MTVLTVQQAWRIMDAPGANARGRMVGGEGLGEERERFGVQARQC